MDGVLTTDGEVTCFDPMGQPLPIRQTYELWCDGTLLATPLETDLAPITLHRVSRR